MSALGAAGSTRAWRRVRGLVLARDEYRCHWCGGQANTVDHLRPRAHGGGDELANLVAACVACNCSRGAQVRAGRAPASRRW